MGLDAEGKSWVGTLQRQERETGGAYSPVTRVSALPPVIRPIPLTPAAA